MEIDETVLFEKLPAELDGDLYWTRLRTDTLNSLKKDVEGLPLTTVHNMLMERMATFYTIMRKRETEDGSKLSFAEIRANQQQWLAMTTEFYKQIKDGEDKRLNTFKLKVQKIIVNILTLVEDDQLREDLRKRLQRDFSDAGL